MTDLPESTRRAIDDARDYKDWQHAVANGQTELGLAEYREHIQRALSFLHDPPGPVINGGDSEIVHDEPASFYLDES